MAKVMSSHVEEIDYDPMARKLVVKWKPTKKEAALGVDGRVSVYSDVPDKIGNEAINAWSIGGFLQEFVKGKYPHEYG